MAAGVKKTLPIAVVAWRASLVSVVRGSGGGAKENTADRRSSGMAGVSGVSGPRFDSRQGTFFLLFV